MIYLIFGLEIIHYNTLQAKLRKTLEFTKAKKRNLHG